MNSVNIIGRLTADPELRKTPSGLSVTKFSIAVNRKGKNDEADFFDCVAWRETAEFITKYFIKGKQIPITGHLATSSWTDKSGNRRTSVNIVIDETGFVGSKDSGEKVADSTNGSAEVKDNASDDLPF